MNFIFRTIFLIYRKIKNVLACMPIVTKKIEPVVLYCLLLNDLRLPMTQIAGQNIICEKNIKYEI